MRKIKPVYISLLVIVVFSAALFAGMQTDWWITEGRNVPIDTGARGNGSNGRGAEDHDDHEDQDEHIDGLLDERDDHDDDDHDEEDHETFGITGGTTVQDALDMGITLDEIEGVLGTKVTDPNAYLKTLAEQQGLGFGWVRDDLNALLGE